MVRSPSKRARRLRVAFSSALLGHLVFLLLSAPAAAQVPATCPSELGTQSLVDHDFGVRFCALCDIGTVRVVVENPFRPSDDLDFTALVITEDLRASGLTYVPFTTTFSGVNVAAPPVVEPVVSGPNGSLLSFGLDPAFELAGERGAGGRESLIVEFDVRRHAAVGEEGLVSANRTIEAGVALTPSCAPADRFATTSGPGALPLLEPVPALVKSGRNVDAGQDAGSYSDPVYGHENDDVIWRIEVQNSGQADLQDFVFSDSIVPGNFEIDQVCDNEADASAAAGGAAPAGCLALGGVTDVIGLAVAPVFGGGATPYIAAPAGGSGFYYLIGRITDSCTNRTNNVFDVEWGCEVESPPGGIAVTSTGIAAGDSADLSTLSLEAGLDVNVALTGTNTGQPMGGRGTVTITISNNTGGTIVGDASGITLRNLLPAEYVVDTTFAPEIVMLPAYGNPYPGMVDTLTWTNPVAGTFPLVTNNPALPLGNTDLLFELTSSTVHPGFADQVNMIRHGDVVTLTLQTVLIDPTYYDRVADVDVRIEGPASAAPSTDPTESFPITNQFEIWYEEFCTATQHHLVFNENDTARPEDLDVDMLGSEIAFILTSTGDPLQLMVELTNAGGHDAEDYVAYVTFGEAMTVQSAPSGCTPTTNPPALPAWQIPVTLPATASVYVCDRGVISPGETEQLQFDVVKNTAPSFDDDLTFRADVIGEITLSDGTPLWFPTPTVRPDGITDRANNYTLDGLRARVVGFDLFKTQLGICTENNPPPGSPDDEVQIGEECDFHVESGGWFGFDTPGFTYIAVQDVRLVDQLPNGQGYLRSTDPLLTSTSAIAGVALNPPPAPLAEGDFDWTFNSVVPAERITERDHWFRADVSTRTLNDPIDGVASPNEHAARSRNVLTSTFQAIFHNPVTNLEEQYNLGPSTVGFPREVHRRVDLTVTEPLLTVNVEVCNETIYGVGPACSNFVTLADDGDAFDTYLYRIRVANQASSGGVTRAPAYDVTVTSVTDPSDLLFVDPLVSDTLDNDGDVLVDGADAAGEGTISDNVTENGIPAQVIASHTHSDALLRIDAGDSVVFYYRVDPDDDVAPLQMLVSFASASYDSLEGASGNQTAPQGNSGEIGGARQYVSAQSNATIQIIPVEVQPKRILRTSNTPQAVPPTMQTVSIGEEFEFELRAQIPVAQLRSFAIRDELPAGLRCIDAPLVNLDAPPYDAAGFVPGGLFTPTCTGSQVVWSFGDQTVTMTPAGNNRFDFGVDFIARVDNVLTNQDSVVLRNGGTSTVATVSYIDEMGSPVVLPVGEAAVVVGEPDLDLTKVFSVADVDAGDVPRVTVALTNNGSAPAYNPRVFEDLSAVRLRYAGDVQGTIAPTEDLLTFGPDRPLFSWAQGFSIAAGDTLTFSFAVSVDLAAEPLELLDNTLQADWTSLPNMNTALNPSGQIGEDGSATGMRIGALPNLAGPLNDYEDEASASLPVRPVALTKTDLDPALAPAIGVHKPFVLEIALPEGTTQSVLLTDDLDSGVVSYVLADTAAFDITYEFEGIASIAGQAPSEAAFAAVPTDGASGAVTWSIGNVVTASENDLLASAVNPVIRIRYFGRVNNDLATDAGDTLQNRAQISHRNGDTGLPEIIADNTAAIAAIEPDLTASKALSNVTVGKAAGDPPEFGDTLQYVVMFVNGGNATAYDLNIVDTLPLALTLSPGFTPTAEIDSLPVAGFVSTPAGALSGPLVWGRGNADGNLDLPAASFLELTYQVEVTTPMPAGGVVENNVFVDWTSLEGANIHERSGDGCPTITPPDDYCFGPAVASGTSPPIPPPAPLLKENTQANAAVGEAFVYRLTIPSAPYGFPQYDVRISDDLLGAAADLRLLSIAKIAGSKPWTPVNTGTPGDPVIEDPTIGIDIPAGEQIVLELTVVLEDKPTNTSGLPFTNTASYVYNWLDGNTATSRPGQAGTSPPMTIVGPDVVNVDKAGPASMTLGTPGVFTLDVHNAGIGPAWNLSVVDQLPEGATGGTCDVAPTVLAVQVFESDSVTPVSGVLAAGSDYIVDFRPAPDCELGLTMLSAAATVGADEHLIVSYETSLEFDTQEGAALSNVAGATEWFSADASSPGGAFRRSFARVLTDGSVGALDHQDAHTLTVALPQLGFEKTVANLTTGESPATSATPGDTLRYRIRVENLAAVPVADFAVTDDLDRLNAPPVFEPGTLALVSVPAGADTSGTRSAGGAASTGVLDVRGLGLANPGDSLLIEFDVTLAGVLPNGTIATNQSQLLVDGATILYSDDPLVNGPADPLVSGDEDATRLPIVSAPTFRTLKISTDLTGDPDTLLAGETLRYTISVENIGSEDATDAMLRDAIPVNTTYVAGSTTLNGASVPDSAGGVAPLAGGITIFSPSDPTPGTMRGGALLGDDVATLVFDVVVNPALADGTVISNQAFVSAVAGGVVDQPSDDPTTALPDDPTRDVVGNAPLLFAPKSVAIGSDGGTPGVVDPLDVLHYTITITNTGAVPATVATLVDAVPANTTWVADSLRLNGLPVGVPDGGVSPLASGIAIASSDLTPPLPAAAAGTLSPGQSARVEFDLQVDAGTPSGTLISNQAVLGTAELPNLLTDGDGNPASGPEPTVVVVGAGQQLAIRKQVTVVGGGAALAGGQLEYVVRVTNVATVAVQNVAISDDIDAPVAGQLTYVTGSATLDGLPAGVTLLGSVLTADWSAQYGSLQPGASALLRFRADIDNSLAIGTTLTNAAVVSWNIPPQTASTSVSIDVGGMPGVGVLNGAVWHDENFDDAKNGSELVLAGWSVELLRSGASVHSVLTDVAGLWSMVGLAPNDSNGEAYALRFRGPGAAAQSAALGLADSVFSNGLQEITDVIVASGANLQDLNLPIDPNGVVYDSLGRAPVAGATLTLLAAGTGSALPGDCFDDPVQQGQITRNDGYYKFDLNFSDGACSSGDRYEIAVSMPAGGAFENGLSLIIPPASDGSTPPFDVPTCPGSAADAVLASPAHCEMQASALAPPQSVPARTPSTTYHTHLVLDSSSAPGTSQLFNNHIAVDPVLFGNIAITKTTPSRNVSRSDLVPYEITVRNDLTIPIPDLTVIDRFPAGFRYIEGSARVDGNPTEPTHDPNARELAFSNLGIGGAGTRKLVLLLAVGAGVTDGKFTNRAQAVSSLTGNALSGEASATVRVVPDPDFACTDVLGKVFDDRNRNGAQEKGERGLAGVRLVTARGLIATTDPHGRFHITCALVPNEERGSNFVLKLDERSLPTGYRMSTRVAQVKRATAGKALRFNYGASIHRIVSLDLADAVFEPGTSSVREHWTPSLDRLLEELAKAPATLRLSYIGDVEDAGLVALRIAAVKAEVSRLWEERSKSELEIESEVYWRRGEPVSGSFASKLSGRILNALTAPFRSGAARDASSGDAVERNLPQGAFTPWTQDPESFATDHGDRLEEREVVDVQVETKKRKGVVPPIRFASGVANIPSSSVEELRAALDEMRHLENVRLHLVGHADDRPLKARLAAVYGDNEGLSHERAGEVAEYLQAALALPPEAISFAYAGDREPTASNATEAGRAQNRRVEVEVWYDEMREVLTMRDVVVTDPIKRVKVCRTETVCRLRYTEGNEQRARIRNLIAPLKLAENGASVPDDFIRQVRQALDDLRDKQNVTVKFIGYTDDALLEGRAARIYGTHLALSKARAHRVARAIQDRLRLPTASVASDGRGAAFPLASNASARGRALNSRIEVEFWYHDPLQALADELLPCPDPGDAEIVTKVYIPPWGRFEPIAIEAGKPLIPAGYTEALQRALDDVAREMPDVANVRLRFVGHTRNERLDRRTAAVYGDDIGLSAARARRTMEQLRDALALSDAQVEHEGRGYVHSSDVVNAGFLQGDTDHVAVLVVYDELAVIDELEGVEVTEITRELHTQDPLALNLMHISADGEPLDDPGRSSADVQRCTDVALDAVDIRLRFDNLEAPPRLSVTSHAGVVAGGSSVRFRMYTNYGHFIDRSEVRIFEQGQSVQADPLAVIEVDADGAAHWQPGAELVATPMRELIYVLRAQDAEGRFDETAPQALWLVPGKADSAATAIADGTAAHAALPAAPDPLLAGYGESGPLLRSIPLSGTSAVKVQGSGIPAGHSVWLAGTPVPVDEHGGFVAEALLPTGMHTVEVAVLDSHGGGELYLRDLEFERSDWFYVGIADLTLKAGSTSSPADALQGGDSSFDRDSTADGRLAFFLKGRFGDDWSLVAHADTREGPVKDLFKNFVDKTPEALFRRIDSDYFYPTFGDDGTVEEGAPTSGKLFAKLSKRENHAMWGNFKVGYLQNELAHVDRGLYGANVHYQSQHTTRFGEQRLVLDGFAAQPGTVPSREEFRGTGGSLYYLRVQDLLEGSERLRIEIRDKDSGLVSGVAHLRPTLDYDIDYLQGRLLLSEPLAGTASDNALVRSQGLDGDEVWLVVQYEYTPGLGELDALAFGGQGHYWLNDFMRIGATANRNDENNAGNGNGANSSLYAADLTLRGSTESWLKLQYGRSEGVISTTQRSDDGGFGFQGIAPPGLAAADGYRADLRISFADVLPDGWGRGGLSLYAQILDAGYSAPGLATLTDTQQYGGLFNVPITEWLQVRAKADRRVEADGLDTTAAELDLAFALNPDWTLRTGVRHDRRDDNSPVVPRTQDEGNRTDGVVQLDYDSHGRLRAYGFGQGTLEKSSGRETNERYGLGAAYRISDRLVVDGEVSHGESGPAFELGTSFQQNEQTRRYMSYSLENERGIDGLHEQRGKLISGARARLSDSGSVYVEDRFQHTDAQNGLSKAMGITLALSERWSLAADWELGTLTDRQTYAETERRAGGGSVGYRSDRAQLSSGIEYRNDDAEQLDGTVTSRTTWLFRNNLRFQITPDWRLLGKFNHSFSDSSKGELFDGGYTEAVIGYAFRPVEHDRLNALAKYTWFSNMPTTGPVTTRGTASQFLQRSHVVSLDVSYDLTQNWSLGGKYAYRRAEVSLDREDPDFFDNSAHLYILRADYRFLRNWEVLAEGRLLDLPDLNERRSGALFTIYRYLGDHFKVGVGYNFTDFSEDLTDLSYDHHGFFLNIVGTL